MSKRIVIALGGNALGSNLEEQMKAVKNTAVAIADLIEEGNEIVIAHGNGPQVGMIQNAVSYTHLDVYKRQGLLRSTQIPNIHAIYVEKEKLLDVAYGAKGIGEIATIPTAPAVQGAYYALDGKFRTKLPLEDTFYRPKEEE